MTESTKKAARAFYALSQNRADSKRYPAIDPIDSYSKYLEYQEVIEYMDRTVEKGWVDKVVKIKDILLRGKETRDQINILGDDGVPLEYHIMFNKAEVVDFVLLQQDAFDKVDASTPMERQQYMTNLVLDICNSQFKFDGFDGIGAYFKKVINMLKQMNYQEFKCAQFTALETQLKALLDDRRVAA